jgi:hypothetical protein
MKEIKQYHVNAATLINLIAVIGTIFFFYRKNKELTEREEGREKRISALEKSLRDSNSHVNAVLTRLNRKISQNQMIIPPPTHEIEEEMEEDQEKKENNSIEDALASLMS